MALVITDGKGHDTRELEGVTFELAYGSDENDWELTLDTASDVRLETRARIYVEGTEYGGVYDGREVDTDEKTITYTGRTWSGILARRFLVPDRGSDYITYRQDANRLIEWVIARLGLGDLFRARPQSSGILVAGQFDRYIDAYSGLCKALGGSAAKLKMTYDGDHVELYAEPLVSYTGDRALDADEVALRITQLRGCVNHLICIGKGELRDRIEIHLFADRKHNISRTQTIFGVDEVAEVYDYSNAEEAELLEKGIEKLRELQKESEAVEVTIASERELDIGDVVGALDPETGSSVTASVDKKIVTVEDGIPEVTYKASTSATVSIAA